MAAQSLVRRSYRASGRKHSRPTCWARSTCSTPCASCDGLRRRARRHHRQGLCQQRAGPRLSSRTTRSAATIPIRPPRRRRRSPPRASPHSFFAERRLPVATARAGNVIGGGDWSADRLVPDVWRAASRGRGAWPCAIRTRPGRGSMCSSRSPAISLYIEALAAGAERSARAQFRSAGRARPSARSPRSPKRWPRRSGAEHACGAPPTIAAPREMKPLSLDRVAGAIAALGWRPRLTCAEAVALERATGMRNATRAPIRLRLCQAQIDGLRGTAHERLPASAGSRAGSAPGLPGLRRRR